MPLFPMFLDLSGCAVLVVGEGAEAERKAEKMQPFCRCVLRCAYPPRYEEPPALVILAEKDHPDNEIWASRFHGMGIPVNVTDRPELCDFRFPSLIVRGEASIGIATGGKCPVLGSLLREQIEGSLPDALDAVAAYAAARTEALRQTIPDPRERTRLLREELGVFLQNTGKILKEN